MHPETGEVESFGLSRASLGLQQDVSMDPKIWSNLSDFLLELIFARLPLRSLLQLRLLSKQWQSNLTAPAFQDAYTDNRSQGFAVVMDSERTKAKRVWAYDVRERKWLGLPLQYLPFSYLVAADGGLLCFAKYTGTAERLQVVVCNPLTFKWRELPSLFGVEMIPNGFHMLVDMKSRNYTITFLGKYNFKEPRFVHVYSSKVDSWEKLPWSREPDVIGRYILVNCYHGSIHVYDIQPGASSSIMLPPDFEHDSVSQVEGSFLFGADQGRLFLLKTDATKSEGVWERDSTSEHKWKEFSRIPRADDLENYFFCVFLCGDTIVLLGERRDLFYGASYDMQLEDESLERTDNTLDQMGINLMLMCDMSTKKWTDLTDDNVEPGCLSKYIVELRLDAVP